MPNSNNSDPIRVVDSLFEQSRPHTAEVRRRSENDAVLPQSSNSNHQAGRLRRGRSAEDPPPTHPHHAPQNKKKNLVQKGLAFLLESTASVARHPSTISATPPTQPGSSSSSPPAPPSRRQHPDGHHHHHHDDSTKFASHDKNYVDDSRRHRHHLEQHHASSQSPVPRVQGCDTYESEFSGYSSPLAGHDFKILPNGSQDYHTTCTLAQQEEEQAVATTLIFDESSPRRVQTIEPQVSSKRDSGTQPRRNHHPNRKQRSSRRGSPRSKHRHHHHSTVSSSADVVGVAGTVTRFLCGAIPTACAGGGATSFSERRYQHDQADEDDILDNDKKVDDDPQSSSRLRDLFQPLRDKVRIHFQQNHDGHANSEDDDDEDPSLERSILSATTASTRPRQRDPSSSSPRRFSAAMTTAMQQRQGEPTSAAASSFFHKYLDFVDAIGLASSTVEDEDDETTIAARTLASSSIMNRSRLSELTPYHRTLTTDTAEEEEQDESLYSVEMTYHDQDEGNNEQHEVPVPSMTLSSESSSETEYDHNNGHGDGADGDDSMTASDESVLSHVSDQMTIDDGDTEGSMLYSARLSMTDADEHEHHVEDTTMVGNVNVELGGDSSNVNISVTHEHSIQYGGVEYAVKVTPPRIPASQRNDDTFDAYIDNPSTFSETTREQQVELQLHQTILPVYTSWGEHEVEVEEELPPLNQTLESTMTSYGSNKDDSIRTVEEQIEAVFCTKKWMSEEDPCDDIVFTDGFYETSSDSSFVVDHVFGLI